MFLKTRHFLLLPTRCASSTFGNFVFISSLLCSATQDWLFEIWDQGLLDHEMMHGEETDSWILQRFLTFTELPTLTSLRANTLARRRVTQ